MKRFSPTPFKLAAATLAVLVAGIASTQAIVIVNYDGTSPDPILVAGGISATPLMLGSANSFNEVPSNALPPYPAGPLQSGSPFYRFLPNNTATLGTDDASALANDLYLTFTLGPIDPGALVNIDLLTLNVSRGGAETPRGYFVRSSIDNFASDITGTGPNGEIDTQRPTFTFVLAPISGGQNLSSFTLRIYGYAPDMDNSIDLDDIILDGTIIPEPATLTLWAVAASGCVVRRRRSP